MVITVSIFLLGISFITNSECSCTTDYNYRITDKSGNIVYTNDFVEDGDSVLVPISNGDTIRMGNVENIDQDF